MLVVVLRYGLERLVGGLQAAQLVAVPDRDGERPARRASCRFRHASMHVGQALLALGSTHENPVGGFPPGALGPVAYSVLPGRPELPTRDSPSGGRLGSGLPASAEHRS